MNDKLIFALVVGIVIMGAVAGNFMFPPDYSANQILQRNYKRDTIECEAEGGFLGGPARDVTCFDVDSIIPLVGPREQP